VCFVVDDIQYTTQHWSGSQQSSKKLHDGA
jgi:hypothetical protein